jgi:hypothetical protein
VFDEPSQSSPDLDDAGVGYTSEERLYRIVGKYPKRIHYFVRIVPSSPLIDVRGIDAFIHYTDFWSRQIRIPIQLKAGRKPKWLFRTSRKLPVPRIYSHPGSQWDEMWREIRRVITFYHRTKFIDQDSFKRQFLATEADPVDVSFEPDRIQQIIAYRKQYGVTQYEEMTA